MLSAILCHISPLVDGDLLARILDLCHNVFHGISTELLLKAPLLLLNVSRQAFFFVDALDEVSVSEQRLLLETMKKMSNMGIQLILTS